MSKQLKQYESTKLFYSEYLYKLVFRNGLHTIFRHELQKKEKLSLRDAIERTKDEMIPDLNA